MFTSNNVLIKLCKVLQVQRIRDKGIEGIKNHNTVNLFIEFTRYSVGYIFP